MPKTIEINVKTRADTKEAQDLKTMLENMKNVEVEVKATDSDVKNVQKDVDTLDGETANVNVDVEGDKEIDAVDQKVESLNGKSITTSVNVEGEEQLDAIQSKKEAIEDDDIDIQLNNQSAMQGINQIADGFNRLKSSAMEVGQQFGNLLASAGKQETNFKFLENAVGNAELARQKMSAINDIVAQLPGDDTALQGLLSSAAAKDSSLTADNLKSMANSAVDYFSAMSYYGKSSVEAQQDMTNYLLAGNTAELERSPILQGHIDKLKKATTVQERSKALAEALNEEHWGGIGAMDTYNNKLETFNGMIERGRYTLGGMFQEGAKSGMDFLLKLDESTNGMVGMGIAAMQLATPVAEAVTGFGQMVMGINAIKETKIAEWASNAKDKLSDIGSAIKNINYTEKFQALSNSLRNLALDAKSVATSIGSTLSNAFRAAGTAARNAATSIGTALWNAIKSVGSAAKTAAINIGKLALNVLKAGLNAMKTVAMWMASAAAKIATAAATTALAIAEWLLASPILLVVIAIVALIAILWYLYNTNDQVRAGIDWFRDSLVNAWNIIVSTVMGAVQSVITFFQNLYQSIVSTGQWIWNSILSVLSFVATVPGRVWSYLMNIINRVIQFGSNVVSRLRSSAVNAVNSFITGIASLPGRVYNELSKTLSRVMEWGSQIVSRLGSIAQQAWQAFVRGLGIGSPGYIQILTLKELNDTGKRIPVVAQGIVSNLAKMAGEAVNAWGTPSFEYGFENTTKKDEFNIGNVEANSYRNLEGLLNKILDALSKQNNSEPSLIFNLYGDMDEEKRMEKFLKAVRRELNWNNKTAGRTIDG